MDVDIGAHVNTRDRRHAGKVSRVVINPRTNEVIDLIVHRHKGVLDARDIVVPVDNVERATKGELQLRLLAAEMEKLPDFLETNYIPPPPEWFAPAPFPPGGILWPAGYAAPALIASEQENVPAGSVTLSEGTEVACPDGGIGVVDEVVSDPASQRVLGFIVRRGWLRTHGVFIPMEWVAEVKPDCVLLNRTKAEVEHLDQRAAE